MTRRFVRPLAVLPLVLLVLCLGTSTLTAQTGQFIRGDVNDDGGVSIADLMQLVSYILLGGDPPACTDTADFNDDGMLSVADPLYMISFLFGPTAPDPIPAPYPDPGYDETPDSLSCVGVLDTGPSGTELPHILTFFGETSDDNEDFAIAPGTELVAIPIRLSADSPNEISGLAISLQFDPTIVAEAMIDFTEGAPEDYSADLTISHDEEVLPGRAYGYIVMEFLSPIDSPSFPVDVDQLLGHLYLRLHDDVAAGTTFTVQFATYPPDVAGAPAIRNELAKLGAFGVVYPHTYPIEITVRPEEEIFIRGDYNRDGAVTTTDAFALVAWLFAGVGAPPTCWDAIDTNDSGTIDIADAFILLQAQFSPDATYRPAYPYPYQGVDSSEDSLNCETDDAE